MAQTRTRAARGAKATVKQVEAIRAAGRHSIGGGLLLVVSASGSRSWIARVRDPRGHRRDIGLGSFPGVGLAEARERVDELKRQVRNQLDPVAEKRKGRHTAIPTFEAAAAKAHDEQKSGWRNEKHRAQWLSSLKAYAFPAIGKLRVDVITAAMVRDLLLPIWLEKPETARRVKQRIGAVLDWAHSKGYREQEAPLRSISRGLPRQPKRVGHFAALPYDDLPELMSKLAERDSIGRLALRFLIFTAARSGEVRGARWSEIDAGNKTWTLPASRMKAGRVHIVPLSDSALIILETLRAARAPGADPLVFPGLRGRPLSDMTLAKALRSAGGQGVTVHGFRSAFRDWVAEQTSFPGEWAEAALAHSVRNKVEAAYRRTQYLEQRRRLMDAWAAFIEQRSAEVLTFHPADKQSA